MTEVKQILDCGCIVEFRLDGVQTWGGFVVSTFQCCRMISPCDEHGKEDIFQPVEETVEEVLGDDFNGGQD